MSPTHPTYLRIRRGPKRIAPARAAVGRDAVDGFWQAYTDATGWRVDRNSVRRDASLRLLPAVTHDGLDSADDSQATPSVSQTSAARLARAATRLASQLRQSQQTMRRQNAELAARAALIAGDDRRGALADRLEQILARAATACQCDSAALYLLDDDTRYLITRSVHGLSDDRISAPPRSLRDSRGDLEALVQGVVAIDQPDSLDTWNCPEPCGAAICVTVQENGLPIGTLWLFRDQHRAFGEPELAAARLTAERLADTLARAATDPAEADHRQVRTALRDLAAWQHRALPLGSRLAEHWRADGMIESPSQWTSGWHRWDVLPDGTLVLAVAEAVDTGASSALVATVAHAALTAHTGYRHTPSQLMQRVNDTLWQTNSGDQLLSLLYARLDPDSGEAQVAAAGSISAMIASRRGYRPLVSGSSEPLGSHIDGHCVTETFRLAAGETLLAYGPGFSDSGITQMSLGTWLQQALQSDDASPLAALRRAAANRPLVSERGAAVLSRNAAP